jgi:hypothetical protein
MGLENGPPSSLKRHLDRTEMVVAVYHKISILDQSARSIGLRGSGGIPGMLFSCCCPVLVAAVANLPQRKHQDEISHVFGRLAPSYCVRLGTSHRSSLATGR